MNHINFIGLGGAGTNIVKYIEGSFEDNTECLVNFETYDASKYSGADKVVSYGNKDLKGSGGDKKTNLLALKEYVDSLMKERPVTLDGTLNVLFFSLSGATGNVLGTLVLNRMLERGENVLVVGIADTSSAQYTLTTQDTLNDLDLLARKKHNCSISVLYKENTLDINEVNDSILDDMMALFMVHSGVTEIDEKDMSMFWNQTRYNRINIPPALYKFEVVIGEELPKENVTTARILSFSDSLSGRILQYKIGKPRTEVVRTYLENAGKSISLVNLANEMYAKIKDIKAVETINAISITEDLPEESEHSIF